MRISLFHLPSFFPEFHASDVSNSTVTCSQRPTRLRLSAFTPSGLRNTHFYNYGGHLPSVPVIGAAVAQRTKNIRIGSGIALLPLQDPIRLAEEYAMLDCLYGRTIGVRDWTGISEGRVRRL